MPQKAFLNNAKLLSSILIVLSLLFTGISPAVQAATYNKNIEPGVNLSEQAITPPKSDEHLSGTVIEIPTKSDLTPELSSSLPIEQPVNPLNVLNPSDVSDSGCLDTYCVYLPLVIKGGPQTPPDGPDLSITLTDFDVTVDPGNTVTYTLSYKNNGLKNATGITLSEILALNMTFNPVGSTTGWQQVGTSRLYTLPIGSLTSGQSGQATFAVTAPNPVPQDMTSI